MLLSREKKQYACHCAANMEVERRCGRLFESIYRKASLANRFHPGTQHMDSSEGYVGTEEALCYVTEHYCEPYYTRGKKLRDNI